MSCMNRKYSDLYLDALKVIQERGWSKDPSTSPNAPVSVRGALDVALETHRAETGTALVAVEFLGGTPSPSPRSAERKACTCLQWTGRQARTKPHQVLPDSAPGLGGHLDGMGIFLH